MPNVDIKTIVAAIKIIVNTAEVATSLSGSRNHEQGRSSVRTTLERAPLAPLEAEELRRICFESGADDVGFLLIDDPEIAAQKADIIKLFPDTRTVVSLLCRMNQEPVRSVVRSVANQEFHETYDTVNATARHIVRTSQDQGRRALNAVAAFPMEQDNFPGKTWALGHKPIAVAAGLGKMGIHRCEPFPAHGRPNRTNLISRLLWQSIPRLCPVFFGLE